MYKEEVKETNNGTELTIDFGKNMMGLSDELISIGEKINELSKTNRVLLRDAFIDELDDVYQLKFVYFPKEVKNSLVCDVKKCGETCTLTPSDKCCSKCSHYVKL